MASNPVRVGNAGGYWGDDPRALVRQLTGGPLDYVTQDFLAEVTMSILQKQRSRKPELGYATDFLDQLRSALPLLVETGVRLISNAGGIHPAGCAEAVERLCRDLGLSPRIAVVEGDDLMDRLEDLAAREISLENLETGEGLESIRQRILSANAYLGTGPLIRALEEGAQLVITGRVTDTALVAAAPAREFGWDPDDWDRLASAVVAGHILECGAQASGGNLTDWDLVPSFENIGFPIAEFSPDGSFRVSKHPATGGIIDRRTVVSQLVYEMGNPRSFITPDVVVDFTSIELSEEGPDRVLVKGIRGRPRPDRLKVSISYHAGYKAHGTMILPGPRALAKARRMADGFWRQLDLEFEETSTERIGYDACHGPLGRLDEPSEILLRLGVRDPEREKVEEFSKTFTALILGSVSGAAIVGARPRVQEVVAYWPCLVPAQEVTPQVRLLQWSKSVSVPCLPGRTPQDPPPAEPGEADLAQEVGGLRKVPLSRVCYARSGDKGNTANIGVVARSRALYPWLREYLSADRVRRHLSHLIGGPAERFEVPNLAALNFLLHDSLGGGGTVSLRVDPQGKTLADALLRMEVEVPEGILAGPSDSGDE